MSKKAHERMLAENEAKAVARMLRVSPQKLNLVAGLIRGKKVSAALADLEFSRKRIARDVRKCLQSAIANAENNHDLDVDDLVVAQLIRGKKVETALADLEFSRKRIAKDVRKCLESAIANAENNHDLEVDDLVVAEAHVGRGLVIKRHVPRGRGRVGRIFKPFANLTIVVRQVEAAAS